MSSILAVDRRRRTCDTKFSKAACESTGNRSKLSLCEEIHRLDNRCPRPRSESAAARAVEAEMARLQYALRAECWTRPAALDKHSSNCCANRSLSKRFARNNARDSLRKALSSK